MENLIGFWNGMSVLGRIELVVFVGAMFFYIRHMVLDKDFTPHPVAFGIWLIADIVNFVTYVSFSDYWVGPAIMPIGAFIVVSIGIYRMAKVRRGKSKITLGWIDWSAIMISIVSLSVYVFTGNGLLSNMAIQVIMFMGFIPIVRNLYISKRSDEPNLPWILFCIGWAITIVDTSLGFESWLEFIYPVINGFIGCAVVLWISMRNKFFASIA